MFFFWYYKNDFTFGQQFISCVYVCVCFLFPSTHDKRACFSYDVLLVSFIISLNKHNSYLSLCVHCVYTELQIMDYSK